MKWNDRKNWYHEDGIIKTKRLLVLEDGGLTIFVWVGQSMFNYKS